MKGFLLAFSISENIGYIAGDDGNRYQFFGKEWKEVELPQRGDHVDFDIDENGQAIVVFYALAANHQKISSVNSRSIVFFPQSSDGHYDAYYARMKKEQKYNLFEWFAHSMVNCSNFSGRARRKEFWYYCLCLCMYINFYGLFIYLTLSQNNLDMQYQQMNDYPIISCILIIVIFIHVVPLFPLTIRRLHDIGKAGWWIVIAFTGIGIIPILILCVFDTEYKDNQWGRPAKLPLFHEQ